MGSLNKNFIRSNGIVLNEDFDYGVYIKPTPGDVITGYVLTAYNDEGLLYWSDSAGSKTLSGLTDVEITGLTDNQIIQYNSGTEKWENVNFVSGAEGTLQFNSGTGELDSTENLKWDTLNDRLLIAPSGADITPKVVPANTFVLDIRNNENTGDNVNLNLVAGDTGISSLSVGPDYNVSSDATTNNTTITTTERLIMQLGNTLDVDTDSDILLSATDDIIITASNDLVIRSNNEFILLESDKVIVDNTGGAPTIESSAIMSVNSTTQGFLPPRMTTAQRTAIATPAEGLMVYDTDTNLLFVYANSTWRSVTFT